MYKDSDYSRKKMSSDCNEYRSNFRRDYTRVLHSSSFRRLQGKTQLFPAYESDFFRNRLTHSLEVAQIAKSIAMRLNNECDDLKENIIDLDIVELSALAHDLGHPPFGHNGEAMLDKLSRSYGGYEGNAQTLRILSRLEKKETINDDFIPFNEETRADERCGLNLTYRSLASILKYDNPINPADEKREKPIKGYYDFDKQLVSEIKKAVTGDDKYPNFKTIECSIMDIADDIAYSVYDLEDTLKGGFYGVFDFLNPSEEICSQVAVELNISKGMTIEQQDVKKALQGLFNDFIDNHIDTNETIHQNLDAVYYASRILAQNGYLRTSYTSSLINKFVNSVKLHFNSNYPALSIVDLDEHTKIIVEALKKFNYVFVIDTPMLRISEHRGKDVIEKIFIDICKNPKLLPKDFWDIYNISNDDNERKRVIIDFIAGMTDRYAVEFYCRLYSENPESIFKPF